MTREEQITAARTAFLASAFPLALVLLGQVDAPLLVAAYWVELVILCVTWTLQQRPLDRQQRTLVLRGCLFLGANVLMRVDWSATAGLVLVSTAAWTIGNLWWAGRTAETPLTFVTGGALSWLALLVFVGSVVAPSIVDAPSIPLSWDVRPGQLLGVAWLRACDAAGLPQASQPALMLLVVKVVNEVVWPFRRAPVVTYDRFSSPQR